MKNRFLPLTGFLVFAFLSASCMTTYDAQGNPVQSVDPGVALAGVVAAGVVGYALADDNHHRGHRRYYHPNPHYYRSHGYRGRGHYHGRRR